MGYIPNTRIGNIPNVPTKYIGKASVFGRFSCVSTVNFMAEVYKIIKSNYICPLHSEILNYLFIFALTIPLGGCS